MEYITIHDTTNSSVYDNYDLNVTGENIGFKNYCYLKKEEWESLVGYPDFNPGE